MNFSSLRSIAIFVLFGCFCLGMGWLLRAAYAPEWTYPDTLQHPPGMRPWQVEADCYSQMARDARILHGQGLLQNHFTAENWPQGLTPSTTAPFDYAILLLYFPLWVFTKHPLDWAGALVSPALWTALAGFWMLIRSREFSLFGRSLLIAGSAALPAIIWATACGRPRHQSLILVLIAMGLTAEYERWQLELAPKRAWNIFAGIIWGLACWTSLFEPSVIAGAVIVFNLIVRRRENLAFLAAFGLVLIAMAALEGDHIFGNLVQIYQIRNSPYAHHWLATIAEVVPAGFSGLIQKVSFVVLITPIVAWYLWPRGPGHKTDMLLILLTILLLVFTSLQSRWNYYASLAILFLVARFCQAVRAYELTPINLSGVLERIALVVLALPFFYWCLLQGVTPAPANLLLILLTLILITILLIPAGWSGAFSFNNPFFRDDHGPVTLGHWTRLLVISIFFIGAGKAYGDWLAANAHRPPNQPSLQLAKISTSIDQPGGIMAPWWLSPGLLYFSGQPIVSGSSHAGMSGIIDSAKFFSARSWIEAEQILADRKVRWVVVWDDPRLYYPVLNASLGILGQAQIADDETGNPAGTVAQMLIEDRLLPTAFHLRAVVEQMKLYEYVPDSP